mmetsp:Transcript_33234/g.86118  ORF Transcript_33234/g.86118 Transcript_33234/m.86118 type:complete len:271 (-) Transcript_33234:980-1792(-)
MLGVARLPALGFLQGIVTIVALPGGGLGLGIDSVEGFCPGLQLVALSGGGLELRVLLHQLLHLPSQGCCFAVLHVLNNTRAVGSRGAHPLPLLIVVVGVLFLIQITCPPLESTVTSLPRWSRLRHSDLAHAVPPVQLPLRSTELLARCHHHCPHGAELLHALALRLLPHAGEDLGQVLLRKHAASFTATKASSVSFHGRPFLHFRSSLACDPTDVNFANVLLLHDPTIHMRRSKLHLPGVVRLPVHDASVAQGVQGMLRVLGRRAHGGHQ